MQLTYPDTLSKSVKQVNLKLFLECSNPLLATDRVSIRNDSPEAQNDMSLSNRCVGDCPPPKQSETHNFKVDLECLLGQTIFLAMKQKSTYVKDIEITLSVNTTKLNKKCQEPKGKYPNI